MGYHRAGFDVVGVDIRPQPNYPFEFRHADALDFVHDALYEHGWYGEEAFDAIHASPPCQHFTKYGNSVKDIKDRYDDLLIPTRHLLIQTGLPYVIENVPRAPLIEPVMLCGSMFEGSGTNDLQRHRLFETNWPLHPPGKCDHSKWLPNRYPGGRWKARGLTPSSPVRKTIEVGRWNIPLATQKWAMGVDWKVDVRELSEAIPPAYTEYVGKRLMEILL
jgi:Site-specific DNA methylase